MHGVVVGKRDTIAYSQVSVTDALRIFPAIFTAPLNAAGFAHWVNAIKSKFVLMKLRDGFINAAFGAGSALRLKIIRVVAILCPDTVLADAPKTGDAALSN
jgi:hypothetical protein